MRYEQAFLNDLYAEEHPDHADKVDLLRSVLEQQIAVLDRGLEVHQMVVPPEMADLQNQLQSAYTHHTPYTTPALIDWATAVGLMKLKRKSQNQKVGDEVVKQMKSSHAAILASAVSHTDLAKTAVSDVVATRKQPAIVTPLFSKLSPGVVPPRSIMSSAAPAPKKLPSAEPRAQSFAVQDPAVPRSLNTASPHTVAVLPCCRVVCCLYRFHSTPSCVRRRPD